LDSGAYINAQLLVLASMNGHEASVQLLLASGVDVNAEGKRYGKTTTALYEASWEGYEGIVRQLLDKGANIHARGRDGHTALQAASERGHEKIETLLNNEVSSESDWL
jgi:ankyrin repeat protein